MVVCDLEEMQTTYYYVEIYRNPEKRDLKFTYIRLYSLHLNHWITTHSILYNFNLNMFYCVI